MESQTIAIIAVGAALGALMLTLFQIAMKRVDSLERRMDSFQQQQTVLQQQQASLAERQSRLEGLMEAIRDMLSRIPLER